MISFFPVVRLLPYKTAFASAFQLSLIHIFPGYMPLPACPGYYRNTRREGGETLGHRTRFLEGSTGLPQDIDKRFKRIDVYKRQFQKRAELKAKMVRLSDTIPNPNEIDSIISRSTL